MTANRNDMRHAGDEDKRTDGRDGNVRHAVTRDRATPFAIAAARGALDAGRWTSAAALCAALAGEGIAALWTSVPLACALLAGISTLSGLAALWYAVRIHIDRRLFAALADAARQARQAQQTNAAHTGIDDLLAGLDDALSALGWIDATKAGRTLDARVRGALGLLRKSLAVTVMQWLAVGIAVALRGG